MWLGIDTSNYTTSLAAVEGDTVISCRRILAVPQGKIGLRQSECVFSHVQNLGELTEQLAAQTDFSALKGIGVSTRPRRADKSYMPVFLAGVSLARSLAATYRVPLYDFSHQDGHIMAALLATDTPFYQTEPFLFLHLSGGTTEWIDCRYDGKGFSTDILAATDDISAGQLIDRIGVQMGLPFPAGKYVEQMNHTGSDLYELPVNVAGKKVNFSGCEAAAMRVMERENYDCAALAHSLITAVIAALNREFDEILSEKPYEHIVIAGGVAACARLRQEVAAHLESAGAQVCFAKREYSSDNAVGIAALAQKEGEHGRE